MRRSSIYSMRPSLSFLIVWLGSVLSVPVLAQTTIAVRVQWDPPPASDGVTSHTLTVDGGAPITVPLAACTAILCEQAVTVSPGSHSFSVTATNQWGTSAATGVTAVIAPPGPPKNLRIIK